WAFWRGCMPLERRSFSFWSRFRSRRSASLVEGFLEEDALLASAFEAILEVLCDAAFLGLAVEDSFLSGTGCRSTAAGAFSSMAFETSPASAQQRGGASS